MHVVSEGGAKFELGPRDRRKVVLNIEPGEEFSPDIAKRAIAQGDHEIKVLTYLDGEVSGGMTYPLSFDAHDGERKDPREEEEDPPKDEPRRPLTIEEILRILRGRQPIVSRPILDRRIRTVRLELDLFDDD